MVSPMLGAFIRSTEPLTVESLMQTYQLTRSRVVQELRRMEAAGHIRSGTFGVAWITTPEGRRAWHDDNED